MAVRHERVVLTLQDDFSTKMARAAAVTAVLNKELDSLSREAVQSSRATRKINQDVDGLGSSARHTEKDIDKLSGRLRILGEAAAILGPGLAPIGAVGVAAISGLVSQLGFATVGAGTAILAFQGLGSALDAMNKAELEPTAENLAAARIELERLSPAAQDFARTLVALKPELTKLRDIAAEGLFPGLERGLDGLETAFPRVERIVDAISTAVGDIAGDAGESLGSERWAPFLDFVAAEGPSALKDFATAAGNTAHALASLWMATDPLNDTFGKWLIDATEDLDKWAQDIGQTQGFADFLAYIEETGPKVAAALGAVADAALQILEAAAPLGGPVLDGITAFANLVGDIADSDLGTPIFAGIAALSLLNTGLRVTAGLQKTTFGGPAIAAIRGTGSAIQTLTADIALLNRTQARPKGFIGPMTRDQSNLAGAQSRTNATLKNLGKTAALVAALGVATTGVADGIGLTNTASLALAGTMAGPWGTAIGAVLGGTLDLAHANDGLEAAVSRVNAAVKSGDLGSVADDIRAIEDAVADLNRQDGFKDWINDFKSYASDAFSDPFSPSGVLGELFGGGDSAAAQASAKRLNAISSAQMAGVAQDNAAALRLMDAGFLTTSHNIDIATQSVEDFVKSLDKANALLNKRDALRNYQAALDAVSESIKANGRGLDINTEQGRANQEVLDGIASSALTAAESIQDPIKRANFLSDAREDFINARVGLRNVGESAKTARKRAEELATKLGLVDGLNVAPKMNFSSLDRGITKANTLLGLIKQIGQNNSNPVDNTFLDSVSSTPRNTSGSDWDGNPKTPYAGGGYTGPGGRLQPAGVVHKGEVVWSQDDVAKYGGPGVVDAMRRGMPGYAGGGTPGLGGFIRNDLDMKYPTSLKQWNDALKASTALLGQEKDKRQQLLDQAQGVRDSIRSGYSSELFGDRGSSVWMSAADRAKAGTGDALSILNGDISRLGSLQSATATLKSKGLDGGALDALLSTGSLAEVQAFASGSKSELLRYENAYNQRERLLTSVGSSAASAAYGPALAASKAQIAATAQFTKAIDRLDGRVDAVVKAIKGAGPKRPTRSFP